MDLRDLSSSSVNVGREGSCSSDDDAALSVTASLAKEASMLFQSEKFSECVEVLNGLLQKKEGDPKILHNIALAEFVRDGCSDPKKLVEDLIRIKRKSEELARESREQTEAASQGATKISSGNKGSNTLANNGHVVFANEFDASVATLNIGTILFQLHEYSKALSVLKPLFENIEPIDETTALHVCLLLLDVAFVTQDAPKFSDVINYLEKAFGVSYMPNQADSGNIGHQQASHLVSKSSSIPNNSSASDDLYSDGAVSGNASDGCLSRMLSDDTMEYETLLSTFDISGKNMSRPSNLLRTSVDRFTPRVNLKLQLPLYKIQLLLLTGNLKAAKREVKLAMNIARGVDSLRTLLLKAQLEYARGNYPKAFKLLQASNNRSDVVSSIIINNNMGCIYHQQGKHNISGVFFHKALRNSSSFSKDKPRKLAQDKSMLIAYNCGVQYLSCGNPLLAAKCFLKASLIFYKRPLLWVRLAECCLVALEKGLLTDSESSTYESVLKIQVTGQGKWRHDALQIDCSLHRKGNKALGSHNMPKLSMSYARECLRNALYLLDSFESKHVESEPCEAKDSASSKTSDLKNSSSGDLKSKDSGQVSVNGDIREHRGETQKIKQTVLVDLAFVELELGNPLKALPMAMSLLELPECSKMYAFLAHIYAAEALCLLNRPKEASEHLFTYLSRERIVELPYTKEDCRQWQVNKAVDGEDSNTPPEDHQHDVFLTPEEARVALYVNLASMHAIQGDLEQAWFFGSRALGLAPKNHEAMVMGIYLDLKLGNTKEALAKLKRCHRVRFCPIISRSKDA